MYNKIEIGQHQDPLTKLQYKAEFQQRLQEVDFLKNINDFLLNIRRNILDIENSWHTFHRRMSKYNWNTQLLVQNWEFG